MKRHVLLALITVSALTACGKSAPPAQPPVIKQEIPQAVEPTPGKTPEVLQTKPINLPVRKGAPTPDMPKITPAKSLNNR